MQIKVSFFCPPCMFSTMIALEMFSIVIRIGRRTVAVKENLQLEDASEEAVRGVGSVVDGGKAQRRGNYSAR